MNHTRNEQHTIPYLNSRLREYLHHAIETAKKGEHENKRYRVATVIIYNGKIEAMAYNNEYNHAEMIAVSKIVDRSDSRNYDMLTVRIMANGEISNAKPCQDCLRNLRKSHVHIRKVFYTDWDGSLVKEPFETLHNTHITSGNRRYGSMKKHFLCV